MTNDNIEALQEILDVPNGVVLFRGDLILPHKDVVELMQYIQQHYDMESKEGMKLKGKHLLVPDLEYNSIVQGKGEPIVVDPEPVEQVTNWNKYYMIALIYRLSLLTLVILFSIL